MILKYKSLLSKSIEVIIMNLVHGFCEYFIIIQCCLFELDTIWVVDKNIFELIFIPYL